MLVKSTNRLISISAVFCLLLLQACDKGIFESGIEEGMIEYTISYPNIPSDSYMQDFLPKKAETYFSKEEYRTDIIAAMGLFKTSIISNKDKEGLIHSIKVLNKKLASELSKKDILLFNPEFQDITIKKSDKKKKIAEYDCKAMDVTVNGDSSWTFTLYYTEEIKIKDANKMSPFKSLDGVLMEYDVMSRDIHMKFSAVKVIKKEIKREDIILAEDYKIISPLELKKEMDGIFNQLK
jgi:hypothetical protein